MKLIFEYMSNQKTQQHQGYEDKVEFDHNPMTHLPQTGIYVAHHDNYIEQHQGVGFSVVPSPTMSTEHIEHINIALASIYSSLQTHTYHPKTVQKLWNIVNQTAQDSFYDDCKNYVININSQQSVFLVSSRFDTPLSVKLNAECTRLFLWAYLTLLESPSIHAQLHIQLHIQLPDDGFTIINNGEHS